MNFINPYITIYFEPKTLIELYKLPFEKEVIWIFLKNLNNRLKLSRYCRVNIYITNVEVLKPINKCGTVYEYTFHLIKPFETTSAGRLEFLEVLYEAFKNIGIQYNWDLEILKDTYIKSKLEVNKFEYFSENKFNRKKNLMGNIFFTLNGNMLEVHAGIKNNSENSINNISLFVTDEDNQSWFGLIREFGWYDNLRFGLKFLNGDLWIVVNSETLEIEKLIQPKKNGLNKIEEFLEQLEVKGPF